MLLFIPFGILIPVLHGKLSLRKFGMIGFIAGVMIEVIQYITGTGSLDANDLIFLSPRS